MRILACGGKKFRDRKAAERILREMGRGHTLVIQREGVANQILREAARECGWHTVDYPADYVRHGVHADGIRNREMMETAPDRVYVFSRDEMTADIEGLARRTEASIHLVAQR